ncbi:CobW family GTP-binding protein [Alkalihalophilus marmarensis]|uniref:CobW family GTP-binding protein n=1 Tax=Alkalihalophilus marmarensis TaxID=521377 RepID=UPI002DB77330|nr:GTP-binding protein [Alkalihalophilus marmarensis]MEC2070666.1 GTP-binding protein [Alkalihalophilus marmarensis]
MKQIPAYVLTGFLGSGKTTVLQRMIQSAKDDGLRPIIVLNELGETNVERHLFTDVEMVELLNGCICCTIQEDMRTELEELLRSDDPGDILFIEGTGIANPQEIMEALTHPHLIEAVQLQSIISVLDTSKFLEYQSRFQSSKEVRQLLKQQVEFASLLLFNKMDLTDDRTLNKVKKKVEVLKQKNTPIIETEMGNVDHTELFASRFKWELEESEKSQNNHHHHHHHHQHTFQAVRVKDVPHIERVAFEKWLKKNDEHIIRAKGCVRLTETPRLFHFQYASKTLQLMPAEREDEPVIILIGTGFQREELLDSINTEVLNKL